MDVAFNMQNGTLDRAVDYLSADDRATLGALDDPAMQKVVEHLGTFGDPYAGAFLSAVPEPASLIPIAFAAAAITFTRRRFGVKRSRRDSNLQPSAPEADALSN